MQRSNTNYLLFIKNCQLWLQSIYMWMAKSNRKLNPDKTQFRIIGFEKQQDKFVSCFIAESENLIK